MFNKYLSKQGVNKGEKENKGDGKWKREGRRFGRRKSGSEEGRRMSSICFMNTETFLKKGVGVSFKQRLKHCSQGPLKDNILWIETREFYLH